MPEADYGQLCVQRVHTAHCSQLQDYISSPHWPGQLVLSSHSLIYFSHSQTTARAHKAPTMSSAHARTTGCARTLIQLCVPQ